MRSQWLPDRAGLQLKTPDRIGFVQLACQSSLDLLAVSMTRVRVGC